MAEFLSRVNRAPRRETHLNPALIYCRCTASNSICTISLHFPTNSLPPPVRSQLTIGLKHAPSIHPVADETNAFRQLLIAIGPLSLRLPAIFFESSKRRSKSWKAIVSVVSWKEKVVIIKYIIINKAPRKSLLLLSVSHGFRSIRSFTHFRCNERETLAIRWKQRTNVEKLQDANYCGLQKEPAEQVNRNVTQSRRELET